MDAIDSFLQQQDERLALLETALAAAPTLREMAWVLCEFCGRELALDDCVVYLAEPGGSLLQHAAWGPKRAADHVLEIPLRLKPGQGVVGDCARQLRPQRVADARQDPRYIVDAQPNLSELAVPIHAGSALFGVLDSEHPAPGYYDSRHEQAFEAIATRGAARMGQLYALTGRP